MTPSRIVAIVAIVAAIAGVGAYFLWPGVPPPPPPGPQMLPEPAAPKGPLHPLQPSAEALPSLKESDPTVFDALKRVLGADNVAAIVIPEDMIRNFVATVDNLPRDHFAMRMSPVHATGGLFKTAGSEDSLAIAPGNGARYQVYIAVLEKTDPAAVVALYARLYPIFQQAYMELGFPDGYFNDRLIEVIDNLLASPEPRAPVKLVVPHVLYEYADSDLEAASAGQKVLMRMGADNEARIKTKLREYRKELLALPAPR
jgi:Protein of unknown function (DUF3014)